ncbi:MAG: S49 family peptidase [Magnetospirillum sp. WYHS-4]
MPPRRSLFRSALALLPLARFRNPPPVVAVVRLDGVILRPGGFHRGLSLAGLAGVLDRAFNLPDLSAVALAVNSPGGSPVQSALIAKRIRALAAEKGLPVYAFAEDVAASGGYWLAAAADKLYAEPASIVGSIGVVTSGFGFPDLLRRLGIERRLYTAGNRKAQHDPFLREKPEDLTHLASIQADMHAAFITWVKERRGGRLKASDDILFGGDFWTGGQALALGLVDGLGDLRTVLRAEYGDKVRLRPIGERRPWWRSWRGPAGSFPADWTDGLLASLEERAAWSRFGL